MQYGGRWSIVAILICVGASQTGCSALSRMRTVPASALSTQNRTNNSATVPISSITNGTNATAQSATKNTTNSASVPISSSPVSLYPSFGLDVTGLKVLALNERLAELGYLPVIVNSTTQPTITINNLASPPQDSFQWRYGNVPNGLAQQWSADTYTELTRAAVIAVEHVNGLPIDGIVGEAVWKAILGPNSVTDPTPYTYVLVTKNPAPETLAIWQAGKWVYQSIVNTGVAAAPSTDGTFAVYERFISQTMSGVNPDGTKYVDKGVPYVNYYNGSEAVHGFPRASYGFPQSVGCIELPIRNAKVVWSLLNYGTLVTVRGKYVSVSAGPTQTAKRPHSQGNTTSNTTSNTTNSATVNSNSTTNTVGNVTNTTATNTPGNAPNTTTSSTENTATNVTSTSTNNTTSTGTN